MEKIKVSVIIPVYNVENFLSKCLDSLINQTLKEIEIICINDNSTDSSLEILEKYAKSDVRIKILNQKKSGVSAARNNGIKAAKGEYIGFVDSDDWVDLDFYEKLYDTAKKHDADISTGSAYAIRKGKKTPYFVYDEEITTSDVNKKFEHCECPEKCNIWNKIYRLDKIRELGIFFEEGIYYEDMIWTPQILYNMKSIVFVPNTYYYYFRHPNSIIRRTKNDKKIKEQFIYAKEKMKNFAAEHNINISKLQKVEKKYKIFGITVYKTIAQGNKKQHILLNLIKW